MGWMSRVRDGVWSLWWGNIFSANMVSTTSGTAAQTEIKEGSGMEEVKATSTQIAGTSEVTAWARAVVVVAAAVGMAV